MDVKPFDFNRLPKVSRQEAALLSAVQSYLPRIGFSQNLGGSIRRLLTKQLGSSFSFRLEKIAIVSVEEKLATMPRQGVYTIIGMSPLEEKAILEIDPLMSHVAIDRLLGGPGEPLTMIRPLNEIEEGVLSFLILKVLSEIFARCGRSARVHWRLDGITSSTGEIKERIALSPGMKAVLLSFHLSLGNRAGYARLILPHPFTQQLAIDPLQDPASAPWDEKELGYYAARLANLGFFKTDLWAEVGRSTLLAGELNGLELGDVVLLQETAAQVSGGRLQGYLPLRIGRGETGALRGRVVSSEGTVQLKLDGSSVE